MLLAVDPLEVGQQSGMLVAGPGRVARLPGPVGEVSAVNQGIGVIYAVCSFADRHQRSELIPPPGPPPSSKPDWRVVKVSGWFGLSTRSRMASSTAN